MALTWKRSEIATKVRKITSLLTEEDISAAALNDRINDFYTNLFPLEVYAVELDDWFTQVTADGDGGEYDISQDYIRLDTPMTILDSDNVLSIVKFYQDKDKFFDLYPEDPDATEHKPVAALLYGGVLYLRPKPDDIYTFKAACKKKPVALSTDDSVPPDVQWGIVIAYGTAIELKYEDKDKMAANELVPIYQHFMNRINQKKMIQRASQQRTTSKF